MGLTIPARLAATCREAPSRMSWLKGLPAIVRDLRTRWSLSLGEPFDGPDVSCAWVAPASSADGTTAILKIGLPHMEAEHEIAGLRFWDGDPTVRLLAADEDMGAMLLERCRPGTSLRALLQPEQDEVISGLLRRVWRLPGQPHPFRPLSLLMDSWSAETLDAKERWTEPALVEEGLRLFHELPRSSHVEVLLATDLHAGNVLKSEREPWLVIDPKPFLGDPAFDATQHLFNCAERMGSDPKGTIGRFAGLLGVDPERVRLWMFARAVAEPRGNWMDKLWLLIAKTLAP